MSDVDKLVAAILAAAKVSAMGERPAQEYIAEYKAFLNVLNSEITAVGIFDPGSERPDMGVDLN
jgi:hypothetical protein